MEENEILGNGEIQRDENEFEVELMSKGIDVSAHQGNINWGCSKGIRN